MQQAHQFNAFFEVLDSSGIVPWDLVTSFHIDLQEEGFMLEKKYLILKFLFWISGSQTFYIRLRPVIAHPSIVYVCGYQTSRRLLVSEGILDTSVGRCKNGRCRDGLIQSLASKLNYPQFAVSVFCLWWASTNQGRGSRQSP